ncbi:MAG: hypothetical protein ACXVCP_15680 [Bdellovibrio sp.]
MKFEFRNFLFLLIVSCSCLTFADVNQCERVLSSKPTKKTVLSRINIDFDPGDMAHDLSYLNKKTIRKKIESLRSNLKKLRFPEKIEVRVALYPKADGTEKYSHAWLNTWDNEEILTHELGHIFFDQNIPLNPYYPSLMYSRLAELFADTLNFVNTNNPEGNSGEVPEKILENLDEFAQNQIINCRSFDINLNNHQPEDWPNKAPFNLDHFYFGPTHTFLSKLLHKTPTKNKYRVVEAVLQASLRLLKSKVSTDMVNPAEALNFSDTVSDNIKIIELIKEEILSYDIPVDFE